MARTPGLPPREIPRETVPTYFQYTSFHTLPTPQGPQSAAKRGISMQVSPRPAQVAFVSTPGARWFPLMSAVDSSDRVAVRRLLDAGDSNVNRAVGGEHPTLSCRQWSGSTPLMLAVRHGDRAIVEMLLDHPGINVQQHNGHGMNAVFHAAQTGRVEIVRLLAERGEDICKTTWHRETPVFAASEAGHVDVVRLLAERHAGRSLPLRCRRPG